MLLITAKVINKAELSLLFAHLLKRIILKITFSKIDTKNNFHLVLSNMKRFKSNYDIFLEVFWHPKHSVTLLKYQECSSLQRVDIYWFLDWVENFQNDCKNVHLEIMQMMDFNIHSQNDNPQHHYDNNHLIQDGWYGFTLILVVLHWVS